MKTIEITDTDAKIKMLRIDTGAMFILIMGILLAIGIKIALLEGVGLLIAFIGVFVLLMVSAMFICVSTFCKTNIQALNIIDWPLRRYVLKGVKDE
jgi:hypothetical protein